MRGAGGTPRTKPAQGRATFKTSVVRRRAGGGIYPPSPSPPGFPRSKSIGGVCSRRSFRSASLPLVANPSLNGSKGEGQPPSRGRGPGGRKKRKPPCLRFFLFRAASCRPPPPHCHSGAYFARPAFRFHKQRCLVNPTADVHAAASPEDWPGVTVSPANRQTALRRTGGSLPVMKHYKNRIPPSPSP
jgi:hypothetical protein